MHIVYPIRTDQMFYGKDPSGTLHTMVEITKADLHKNIIFTDNKGAPLEVNGYDSSQNNEGRGTRVTNLARITDGILLKKCPHCDSIKDQDEFGEEGRTTNEFRDQSHCNPCRQLAGRNK